MMVTDSEWWLMWVKQCHFYKPPIFLGMVSKNTTYRKKLWCLGDGACKWHQMALFYPHYCRHSKHMFVPRDVFSFKYWPDHSAFWASNCSDVTHWSSDAFSEPWEFQSLPVSRSEAILLGCQHADMEKTWPLAFWHLDVCSACIFSFWCVVVLLMAILFWRLGSLRVPDSIDWSDESQSILWVDSQRRDSRETWGSVSF